MTRMNMAATVAREDLMSVLEYNPETGEFAWKDREHRPGYFAGRKVGTLHSNGRLYISINAKRYLAHRLAWFYVVGRWPNANVVPKNGDYLDLRFSNLKLESASATARKSDRRAPSSGERGVSWDTEKKKWRAEITTGYKTHTLGRFQTKAEAVAAYKMAARDVHEFSTLDRDARIGRREKYRSDSNIRRLWRRTLESSGGVTGWDSYEHFCSSVKVYGDMLNRSLEAADKSKKIGPDNYQWSEGDLGDFDHMTPEGRAAYLRAYRVKRPSRYKDSQLRKSFGITKDQYDQMLKDQNHVCAICEKTERVMHKGRPRDLAVDHCHETGVIRGLLCSDCNSGLGWFSDNITLLHEAATYVEHHARKHTSVPASNVIPIKAKER